VHRSRLMSFMTTAFAVLAAGLVALLIVNLAAARKLEARFPPRGDVVTLEGQRVHFLVMRKGRPVTRPAARSMGDAVPLLVFHGASGNLRDGLLSFGSALSEDRDVILFDRPGLGWSTPRRDPTLDRPDGQAQIARALLDHLGVQRAIAVGHSYGASVAAAFALSAPTRTAGLVAIAPATHPWPGGVKWFYSLASWPVVGHLFTTLVTLPVGLLRLDGAVTETFRPNPTREGYREDAAAALLLTPRRFRANARDITALHAAVSAQAPCYSTITAPTLVLTGDRDQTVWKEIHAHGLRDQIAGARYVELPGIGHMPQHSAADRVMAEIAGFASAVDGAPAPSVAAVTPSGC